MQYLEAAGIEGGGYSIDAGSGADASPVVAGRWRRIVIVALRGDYGWWCLSSVAHPQLAVLSEPTRKLR